MAGGEPRLTLQIQNGHNYQENLSITVFYLFAGLELLDEPTITQKRNLQIENNFKNLSYHTYML